MTKYRFALMFLLLISPAFAGETSFTLSAEVEKAMTVKLEKGFVMDFIRDISIYPKYFPDIVSVRKLSDSTSEWVYKVEAPLASPFYLTFVLKETMLSPDSLVYESVGTPRDYLLCRSVFTGLGDSRTHVKLYFKLSMTRDKASDIHFLAGLLGEKFLSEMTKEKLEDDIDTFIESVTKEMYDSFRRSGSR